jgi:asparagine synthase (glutamine-hydrolysing)
MPGLTLAVGSEAGFGDVARTAQALLVHGPHYRTHSAATESAVHLGWVAYETYPVVVWSDNEYVIYLEGRIYNESLEVVHAELLSIAADALGAARGESGVRRFVSSKEGSYLVAILRRDTRALLVFNDIFGRLPVYYSVDSRLILAREAKFVHALQSDPSFDRIGCAQFLAFGLPLGDRTVLSGVKSFPDAALLRAELVDGRICLNLQRLHSWNLDDEERTASVGQHATRFADAFVTACRAFGNHEASSGNIASLSGGHDSRAVVAGLVCSRTPVIAVTYRDPIVKRENEVICAQRLTQALGVEWHCIDLPPPPDSAYEELAWLKDGMNWASMAYILNYLEQITQRWGRSWTYLSGDGGDDCLKVTAPRRAFTETRGVAEYLLEHETYIPPAVAEAILKVPRGTLADEIHQLLESYPEEELARRVKHFKIFERGRRCYFEGEDRTRSFLWQDSPFYSQRVFRHCMRVPDKLKEAHVFCRQALLALSPAAASAPEVSSGFAPASWKYATYHWAKDRALGLPPPVVTLLRSLTRSGRERTYMPPSDLLAHLKRELAVGHPLAILFERDDVLEAMKHLKNDHAFFCLWTVAMLEKAYRLRMDYADTRASRARSISRTT